MKTITIADLFCGAGGTSTGAIQAIHQLGHRAQLTAVNHWDRAVATHTANHPEARHLCASVDSLNPRHLFREGELDILWASPECQNHSLARGGRAVNDQSRATAWCVARWSEALRPSLVLVENVPRFLDWGPLDENERPIKERKGEIFRAWIASMQAMGYTVDWRILCAADYGDPTTRERLFVQAVRGGRQIVWPEPTHDQVGSLKPRWRGAREIINWDLKGGSIFRRKKPLSSKTLDRIWEGLRKHGLDPSIVVMENGGRVRNARDPLPTITTARGGAMALAQPFLVHTAHGGERPSKSVDRPIPTVCGNRGDLAVIEPHLLPQHSCGALRSVDRPAPTITCDGAIALVQPYLTKYYGTAEGGRSIDRPLDTLTTKDRYALVEPTIVVDGELYKLDILFRMLTDRELADAQGFPGDYQFTGNKTERVKQIGNAVPPGLSRALIRASLTQHPINK